MVVGFAQSMMFTYTPSHVFDHRFCQTSNNGYVYVLSNYKLVALVPGVPINIKYVTLTLIILLLVDASGGFLHVAPYPCFLNQYMCTHYGTNRCCCAIQIQQFSIGVLSRLVKFFRFIPVITFHLIMSPLVGK